MLGALLSSVSQYALANLLDHLAFGSAAQQAQARRLLPSLLGALLVGALLLERLALSWHAARWSRVGPLEFAGMAAGAFATRFAAGRARSEANKRN